MTSLINAYREAPEKEAYVYFQALLIERCQIKINWDDGTLYHNSRYQGADKIDVVVNLELSRSKPLNMTRYADIVLLQPSLCFSKDSHGYASSVLLLL